MEIHVSPGSVGVVRVLESKCVAERRTAIGRVGDSALEGLCETALPARRGTSGWTGAFARAVGDDGVGRAGTQAVIARRLFCRGWFGRSLAVSRWAAPLDSRLRKP